MRGLVPRPIFEVMASKTLEIAPLENRMFLFSSLNFIPRTQSEKIVSFAKIELMTQMNWKHLSGNVSLKISGQLENLSLWLRIKMLMNTCRVNSFFILKKCSFSSFLHACKRMNPLKDNLISSSYKVAQH